jgi:hypothetical protein
MNVTESFEEVKHRGTCGCNKRQDKVDHTTALLLVGQRIVLTVTELEVSYLQDCS